MCRDLWVLWWSRELCKRASNGQRLPRTFATSRNFPLIPDYFVAWRMLLRGEAEPVWPGGVPELHYRCPLLVLSLAHLSPIDATGAWAEHSLLIVIGTDQSRQMLSLPSRISTTNPPPHLSRALLCRHNVQGYTRMLKGPAIYQQSISQKRSPTSSHLTLSHPRSKLSSTPPKAKASVTPRTCFWQRAA